MPPSYPIALKKIIEASCNNNSHTGEKGFCSCKKEEGLNAVKNREGICDIFRGLHI